MAGTDGGHREQWLWSGDDSPQRMRILHTSFPLSAAHALDFRSANNIIPLVSSQSASPGEVIFLSKP